MKIDAWLTILAEQGGFRSVSQYGSTAVCKNRWAANTYCR